MAITKSLCQYISINNWERFKEEILKITTVGAEVVG